MPASRRDFLGALLLTGAASGGLYAYQTGQLNAIADVDTPDASSLTGPPETDTKIGETGDLRGAVGGAPIENIEFYESGAAVVKPVADRGDCGDRFAIMHETSDLNTEQKSGGGYQTDTSDALQTWSFGEFDEEVTIDLASAISERSNYPSKKFRIEAYPEGSVCLSDASSTFNVPDELMP